MSSERLKEITLEIVKLESPLSIMAYITTLSNSDINVLFSCVKDSKYSEMNVYSAILAFSCDYLRSVNCALPNMCWGRDKAQVPKKL